VPTTLLAIDDSVTMRKVLENTFAGEDFRVVTADGVEAGLAKLRSERPAIVLTDVTLDGPGGYGLCAKVKAESPNTPVIILASKQQPYDAAKGQASHADDFVEKPFDTQQLIDKVRRLLGKPVGAEAPAARPAAPVAAPPLAMPAAAAPAASGPASTRGAVGFAPGMAAKSPAGATPPLNPRPTASGMGTGQTPPTGGVTPGGRATLSYVAQPGPLPAPGAQPGRGPAQPPQAPVPQRQPQPVPIARAPQPVPAAAPPARAAAPAAPATPAAAIAAATGGDGALAARLAQMGLTEAQVTAILALSREVVEKVVWEVVPVLAETMIKEEIHRLTAE
jgi:CheY-like chemotaxis protein